MNLDYVFLFVQVEEVPVFYDISPFNLMYQICRHRMVHSFPLSCFYYCNICVGFTIFDRDNASQ